MHGIFHTILSGATVGIYFLATAAFILRFVLRNPETLTARRADTVMFVSAAAGTVLGTLTLLTGLFGTWSMAAIADTVLAQNKLLVAVAAIASFGMLWLLRYRAGRRMWQVMRLRLWAAVLMASGFVNVALAGSMGGSATLKGTALDPAMLALNINRYVTLSWGPILSAGIIVLSALAAVYTYLRSRKPSIPPGES
jgi:hypothetical protein